MCIGHFKELCRTLFTNVLLEPLWLFQEPAGTFGSYSVPGFLLEVVDAVSVCDSGLPHPSHPSPGHTAHLTLVQPSSPHPSSLNKHTSIIARQLTNNPSQPWQLPFPNLNIAVLFHFQFCLLYDANGSVLCTLKYDRHILKSNSWSLFLNTFALCV